MPWRVRKIPVKSGKNWAIQKLVNGAWRIVGRSNSKKEAEASVRARRASEGD